LQSAFDITGDLDTPVSAFMKLGAFAPRFLLESVEGGERLIEQQDAGIGHEGASQSYSLAFAAGNLSWRAVAQMRDTK